MECHLGPRNKFVDHEMIAAGHPDLYFRARFVFGGETAALEDAARVGARQTG